MRLIVYIDDILILAESKVFSFPGPFVLPQAAAGTAERARTVITGLFSQTNPFHRGEGGAGMVVGPL